MTSRKKLDKVAKIFSKRSDLAYFELDSKKDKRTFFMHPEDGSVICMLRDYKGVSYHPHIGMNPVMAAFHGYVIAGIGEGIKLGEDFYFDAYAEDVYYGELALEAFRDELGV